MLNCVEERQRHAMKEITSPPTTPDLYHGYFQTMRSDKGDGRGKTDVPVLICLLGGFRLLERGQAVSWCGEKTEALLSNLAIEPGYRLPRETLLQRLWPDREPKVAGQSLNSLIHSLRKHLSSSLGGATSVMHEDGYYSLNIQSGIEVDVDWFEQLVKLGERNWLAGRRATAIRALSDAIALYTADLSPTFAEPEAALRREWLRSSYLAALWHLSQYRFMEGDYRTCIEVAHVLLAKEPCKEEVHRLIMRSLVLLGDRAQALRHYRVCAQVLRSEYDAMPDEATVDLYDQIRLQPGRIRLQALTGDEINVASTPA